MILLGNVIRTQIQRKSLKVNAGAQRIYDPAPIISVPQIKITQHGVVGVMGDGAVITDVHHAHHPESRNRGNTNGVSLNFISNYVRMNQHFPARPGKPIFIGLGGENLIVEQALDFSPEHIDARLMLQTPDGNTFYLDEVMAIPPCAPFSNFLAGQELKPEDMRKTLEFLSGGTRGFYATLSRRHELCMVQPGTKLYAV